MAQHLELQSVQVALVQRITSPIEQLKGRLKMRECGSLAPPQLHLPGFQLDPP
jgi:hypothetical protein